MLAHAIGVLWVPTHPPCLNFCSSLGKAKPKAMHEIWDNTSVDPCLDIPNGLMRPYLAVATYIMLLFVEFFTSSWAVERWNLLCVSLLLSLFFKSIRENMILYYYGSSTLRTRALFLVCGFSPLLNKCSFSSYPLKAKYVELVSKGKGYNSSHVYCQAKGWSKKS
jgi:hypothetical protein